MTVWHWVRHAPTHAKTFVGWRDLPGDLSDFGQINRLRDHLPEEAFLLSSDLNRAAKTANALQKAGYRRLPDDAHLREIHFGLWDGMHFEDISARDAERSRRYWETPGDVQPPLGESWNEASTRVQTIVSRINHLHPDAHVVATAHFGVILTQLQRAMGISAYDVLAHRIDNLSVTRLLWENGAGKAELINHCP